MNDVLSIRSTFRRCFSGLVILIVSSVLTMSAATIEDFSAVSSRTPHFAGTWEASMELTGSNSPAASLLQGDGIYQITGSGVTNDAGSFMEFHFNTPLDLAGQPFLEVAAEALAGNAASSFEIRLFDTSGRTAFALYALGDFPEGEITTNSSPLVFDSGFDGTSVETMRITGGILDGADPFSVSFDEIGTSSGSFHDADFDQDGAISLSELLRVIELYNTRFGTQRTGAYRLASSSSDGFQTAPDIDASAANMLTRYHSADYSRDGRVSLSELLRVIELYNFREGTQRVGSYQVDPDSVDGFRPGLRD